MSTSPAPASTESVASATPAAEPNGRLFTFASGGWVLVLAFGVGVFIVIFTLLPALRRLAERPPGDGRDPASYGFVLTPSDPTITELIPAQLHRDMATPFVAPEVFDATDVAAWTEENRGKYLVSGDVVAGVAIGDEARAYPQTWMQFHEVANDRVGDVPVLVVWGPLARVVAVYDRRVDGRTLQFGTSGLLDDSTMLLYGDDEPDSVAALGSGQAAGAGESEAPGPAYGGESLWDPVTGRAVTGPDHAAGLRLTRIPFSLTQYAEWMADHPASTILARDELLDERYEKTSFERYWAEDDMLYPVTDLPMEPVRAKEPCLVIPSARPGEPALIVPFTWVAAAARVDAGATGSAGAPASADEAGGMPADQAYGERDTRRVFVEGPDGRPVEVERPRPPVRRWTIDGPDGPVTILLHADPPVMSAVDAAGEPVPFVQSAWFAWKRTGQPARFVERPAELPASGGTSGVEGGGEATGD